MYVPLLTYSACESFEQQLNKQNFIASKNFSFNKCDYRMREAQNMPKVIIIDEE